jgi:hypothetical protein
MWGTRLCCSAQDFPGGPVSYPRGSAKPVEDFKESLKQFADATKPRQEIRVIRPVILLRERSLCHSLLHLKGTSLNDHILNAIDEELAKLRQARAILDDSGKTPISKTSTTASHATASQSKPRRKLSAKARKAIAEAQRKRWAKAKSQKKAAAPTVTAKKEAAAS